VIKWVVYLKDCKNTSGAAAQLVGDSICSGVRPLAPNAKVITAPEIAMPIAPPILPVVSVMPEAAPTLSRGTVLMIAL